MNQISDNNPALFQKIKDGVLQRNPSRSFTKSFIEYTQETLQGYLANPASNADSLRQISRYLTRVSQLYKNMLEYLASLYEYNYNIIPKTDITKPMDDKLMDDYYKTALYLHNFNLAGTLHNIIYNMARDGMSVSFVYNSEEEGIVFMPLDIKYCRIWGRTSYGTWIVYFDAAFFDQSNNSEYIYGVNQDGVGAWDDVFREGYETYKEHGRNYEWFMLPPELTACFICSPDDEFAYSLPYFLPLFLSLLRLLDQEKLVKAKNELEIYKLIMNKIPMIDGSEDVDDMAISLDLANYFTELMQAVVPETIGVATTPFDTDVVSFQKSNSTKDTDEVATSMNNLLSNAGLNKLIVSSGNSTNASGIKYSVANDLGKVSTWVRDIENFLNYFILKNINDTMSIQIYDETRYNHNDFVNEMKEAATLGGSKMDYLLSLGESDPYQTINKLRFENDILKIADYMIPLQSTYTQSSKGGAPTKPDDEISDEGQATRDSGKNEDKGNKI